VAGFCKPATRDEIRSHGHVLTPGRYVGAEEVEDDGEPFEQKMKRLVVELASSSPSRPGWRGQVPRIWQRSATLFTKTASFVNSGDRSVHC
jgi:hypothetical protein